MNLHLRLSPTIRRYANNVTWVISEKIIRMIAGLFVGLYVARYLGPEKFGLLNFAVSYASIFAEIARCGLDAIVIRDLVGAPEGKKQILLGTAFYIKLAAGIATTLLVLLSLFFTPLGGHEKLFIAIISAGFLFQSAEIIDFYFQSEVKSKFVSICRIWQIALSSAAKLVCVFLGCDLVWFVVITLIDQITLSALLMYIYWKNRLENYLTKFDSSLPRKLLKDSWPILLSSVAIVLYMRLDQIMLKGMLGDAEVGHFSASIRISELWYFIPMTVSSSLFPSIIGAYNDSSEKYSRRVQGLYDLVTWLSLAPIVVVCLYSQEIIELLYGKPYLEAAPVLLITIWAGLPVSLGVARSNWMVAENLQRLGSFYVFFGAGTKLALNFLLIPRMGIVGAGLSTLVSQGAVAFFAPLLFAKTRPSVFMFLRSLYLPGSAVRLYKGEWR